jgi:hypothetical protein
MAVSYCQLNASKCKEHRDATFLVYVFVPKFTLTGEETDPASRDVNERVEDEREPDQHNA